MELGTCFGTGYTVSDDRIVSLQLSDRNVLDWLGVKDRAEMKKKMGSRTRSGRERT